MQSTKVETKAVTFELPATELAGVVGEMLRLGNDRQTFHQKGRKKVALSVIDPPYYSTLRALDVGVLTQQPDQLTDIYTAIQFVLHKHPSLNATEPNEKVAVPLYLSPSSTKGQEGLWIVSKDALKAVDEFVASNEAVLGNLAFAVADDMIVLQLRQNRTAHVFIKDASSFRPFKGVSNLFLPSGCSLSPPLRPELVRKLLANDLGRVFWMMSKGDSFVVQSLPHESFYPLEMWHEYIISHDSKKVLEWMNATKFHK